MTKFLVAFASLAIAGMAAAQTEQPRTRQDQAQAEDETSQDRQEQAQQKQERLICRRVGMAATGSSMGHRRCLTAAQWRALNQR